ncbi:MAG: aquaporin [Planctomycetes bacterium]|nr:aquaporin [Planctomycetota bacterium]
MNATDRSSAAARSAIARWVAHGPEYLIEAWALGTFMLVACVVAVAFGHDASPLRAVLGSGLPSRFAAGLVMGATAVLLITSPWGRRSGAHMNPAVTLAFLRLGRIDAVDAVGYVAAQCVGGIAGVAVARLACSTLLEAPSVRFAATVPGPSGIAAAFCGELVIAFLMMAVVLMSQRAPRTASWTPWLAGSLVCIFITFESPLSGMSMNPARTLASALHADEWTGAWLYAVAPVLGMALAAHGVGRAASGCAKLMHCPRVRCIFCGEGCGERRGEGRELEPCASDTATNAVNPRTSSELRPSAHP